MTKTQTKVICIDLNLKISIAKSGQMIIDDNCGNY